MHFNLCMTCDLMVCCLGCGMRNTHSCFAPRASTSIRLLLLVVSLSGESLASISSQRNPNARLVSWSLLTPCTQAFSFNTTHAGPVNKMQVGQPCTPAVFCDWMGGSPLFPFTSSFAPPTHTQGLHTTPSSWPPRPPPVPIHTQDDCTPVLDHHYRVGSPCGLYLWEWGGWGRPLDCNCSTPRDANESLQARIGLGFRQLACINTQAHSTQHTLPHTLRRRH